MQRAIVADTSCLILLSKIGALDLLKKVFGEILITDVVRSEYKNPLPKWIITSNPSSNFHKGLEYLIDVGEASSIGLALDLENCLLIIDELKGRNIARQFGINITGTLGVLLAAKQKGHISSVKSFINQINKTDFRLSEDLIDKVLNLANEN